MSIRKTEKSPPSRIRSIVIKKFSIPWRAPSLNKWSRMHWSAQRALNRVVGLHVLAAIGRPSVPARKARVTVQIFRVGRRFDRDNCVIARKYCCDALVRLGWLVNDSPVWCESVDLPCQSASEDRVEVTLEYTP